MLLAQVEPARLSAKVAPRQESGEIRRIRSFLVRSNQPSRPMEQFCEEKSKTFERLASHIFATVRVGYPTESDFAKRTARV